MLSRSTGCRQKTLQARQSACRWITITTCLFIHVFICVFIFSLYCEGDKKCWLRQWHADTKKHMLGVEVVSLWRESWCWAGRQRGNWSDCLPCLDGIFFYSGENKSIVDSEKPGADCARHGSAARAAWQAPYIWLIWSLRAHTAPQMESNSYPES